ncbi:MAG: SMC-Scp complex subunit ScpB [Alphaproteobacteria bacterium]|nr:SMC-Scp complex subunit ScpB [Alphaproteobacteria bacterium]
MTVSDAASESSVVELVADNDEADAVAIEEDLRLVEALLFASASAVTEKVIAERLGEGVDIPSLLGRLKELYKGRGVELTRAGNRWFFRTAPDLGDRLKLEKMVPRKLSRAGTETLAIIAYHQPVTRAEIEEIRGVVISRGTIDILLEEGWIKPRGRRHTPGRPMTWGTSDAFLDHFGLESLNDLPGIEELKAAGLLDSRQGLAAYNARAEQGETLLFDTDESDEALDPLEDGDEPTAEEAPAETFSDESDSANDQSKSDEELVQEDASDGDEAEEEV